MRSRARKLLFAAAGSALAAATALVLGEVGLRIYYGRLSTMHSLRPQRSLSGQAPANYDARTGWVSRPGTYQWSEGWSATVDEYGMRVSEAPVVASMESTAPVLVVGDSYTFGDEVDDDETWPAQLAPLIDRRVLNGGVSGYGVDQAVLQAERLVRRCRPALLVLAFIPADIDRCELSQFFAPKPYFDFVDGELELMNVPVPVSPRQSLWTVLDRSFLARAVIRGFYPDVWLSKTREHERGLDVACELVTRLANYAQHRDTKLALVALPSRYGDLSPLHRVAEHARELDVPVLDLGLELGPRFRDGDGRRKWFHPMGHYTAEANAVVAAAVADFVKQEL